jgi:hypothetical protein
MAFTKKGLRKITVEEFRYCWSTKGSSGCIGLTITPLENKAQQLTAIFDYHNKVVEEDETEDGRKFRTLRQQLVITPYIVRQVIKYGIEVGWSPMGKGPHCHLGEMDDKIDLRITEGN